MAQRVFQDAAGTIPAISAGQRVGLVKRMAGTVDASQPIEDDRPILARWPTTGVRNEAAGAQAVGDDAFWKDAVFTTNLDVTKVGSGLEDGVPYVDYRYQGIPQGVSAEAIFVSPSIPAVMGDQVNARVQIKRIAGTNAGLNLGFMPRCVALLNTANTGQVPASPVLPSEEYQTASSGGALPGETTNRAKVDISVSLTLGVEVDITVRIKGLQFERGAVQTPLQLNYGPNDITEAGVADLWHLYNSGGDNLSLILPPGTYGVAALAVDRRYRFDTLVSDGSTPVVTITTEREVDAIYRLGAFSGAEQIAIQAYWDEVYPL